MDMNTRELSKNNSNEHEPMPQGFSIAIDGPVASGKGTLATALAERIGGFYINTGAMYRAVALLSLERGIDINNEAEVNIVLPDTRIEFKDNDVFLNGRDITERITKPDISHGSSVVAIYGSVRKDLVRKQQQMAKDAIDEGKTVIAEGRDTGTKVFPNSALKIFLTARPEVRALRRTIQYQEKGINKEAHEVLGDLKMRDERDMNREIDPLPSNPSSLGYYILDNSNQTEEESLDSIITELKRRGLIHD